MAATLRPPPTLRGPGCGGRTTGRGGPHLGGRAAAPPRPAFAATAVLSSSSSRAPASVPPAITLLAADVREAPPARRPPGVGGSGGGGSADEDSDAARRARSSAAGAPSGRPDGPDPDFFANVGHAIRTLREDIPALFDRELDWSIYRDDVVFRDPRNCFKGLKNYKIIFWSLRFHGKLFFSSLRVDVSRIWQPDPKEVRVRWTVVGHPRGPFSPSTVGIFDGVSTFRLDSKGLVYEHSVDNVILRPRGGVLKSPLFAGLGLAGLGSGGVAGRVAVPGGAGGGGGDGGFPVPNFRNGGRLLMLGEGGGAEGEGDVAAAAACAASSSVEACDRPHTPTPVAEKDPTRLAAARGVLAAAWATSSQGAFSAAEGSAAAAKIVHRPVYPGRVPA